MSSMDLMFSAALIATLIPIAVIDFRDLTIPDWLNLVLAALGLSYGILTFGAFPWGSVVFAVLVFLGFWLVRLAHQQYRGVTGLGFGDVKMAGGSALWFSPWNLPLFLLTASVSALVFVVSARVITGRRPEDVRIPFGPFIGLGLFVTWALERSIIPTFMPDKGF